MVELTKVLEIALVNALNNGFVMFTYRKIDGSTRCAVGTRNVSAIVKISSWRPKGGKENDSTISYFDLGAGEWRCFRKGNLLEISVADFSKQITCATRYIISQDYATRVAISYELAEGNIENVKRLVNIVLGDLPHYMSLVHIPAMVETRGLTPSENAKVKTREELIRLIRYHTEQIKTLTDELESRVKTPFS